MVQPVNEAGIVLAYRNENDYLKCYITFYEFSSCRGQNVIGPQINNLIKKEMININNIFKIIIEEENEIVDEGVISPFPKKRKILEKIMVKENKNKIDEELNNFKNEVDINYNNNIFEWWKIKKDHFPILSILVKKYLCIPSTSAAMPSQHRNLNKSINLRLSAALIRLANNVPGSEIENASES